MDLQTFQNEFNIWLLMMSFGNASRGLNTVVEYLKNKYV